jgi:KDO2-lipid IV(A) lauroyltransferase
MMRYKLEYIPFIITATIVRLLPRSTALALGRMLGKLGMLLQPKRVKIADKNLRHAFPDKTSDEREVLVKKVFSDMGVGLIEMVRLDMFDGKQDLEKLFTIEGEEHPPRRTYRFLGSGQLRLSYPRLSDRNCCQTDEKPSRR